MANETSNDARNSTRKQAEKAKTQAREVADLLEQARRMMAEDSVVQPAMEPLCAALRKAEGRATVLEDWYRRTYLPVLEGARTRDSLYVSENPPLSVI